MRSGTNAELVALLEAAGITTALMASLEFKSETINIWTGSHRLEVQGSTDSVLNGKEFDPLVHGVVLNIGDNSFSMSGSDALEISLAIPSAPSTAISAASVYPDEYQGRNATLWRALMIAPSVPGTPATWAFRRVRVGAMDTIKITNDGLSHQFTLAIEGHASLISNATGSNYLDQRRFDANDASQDYTTSCANGDPAPTKQNLTGWAVVQARLDAGGTMINGVNIY
ncbi:hypothetical protein SAMN05192583_0069 [Sphingomonas gellani]|uniref:Uncharacterized protein n=1 Tax=Sphingomonas gellani TaxID=1166340 RepID=A0A1H7Y3A3_9SPHN|nr:hypothetical protein [Sphingomonas gellani]SEM40463.1 hypothetical protein SAMN05192583_0069 [Sphingomonas gellani]